MIKLAICTFSRSEYGLLKGVIRHVSERADTWIIAGAGHLAEAQGMTMQEIFDDDLVPADRVLVADFTPDLRSGSTLTATISKGLASMAEILDQNPFDALVVMGDRYELFTISVAALLHRIPLVHISGGEVSEGAIDDSIRHATTKLAHLHLVANRDCALNVSRMGEEDWRIVITGEPGMDNIHQGEMASREEVKRETGLDPGLPTLLVTLHPETLTPDLPLERQYTPLLEALASLTSYQVVITAPAAEEGAPAMIAAYKAFAAKYQHVIYFPHLGSRNYLAVMKFSMVVVGNSSSGLTEAPSMGVPTVNIGNRQKNRMAAKGVIHCGYDRDEILQAIALAATEAHRILCRNATNPYDPYRDGMNSLRAARAITAFLSQCSLQRQIVKQFDTNTNPEQWNSLLK